VTGSGANFRKKVIAANTKNNPISTRITRVAIFIIVEVLVGLPKLNKKIPKAEANGIYLRVSKIRFIS
jgi:hypothetical protein